MGKTKNIEEVAAIIDGESIGAGYRLWD